MEITSLSVAVRRFQPFSTELIVNTSSTIAAMEINKWNIKQIAVAMLMIVLPGINMSCKDSLDTEQYGCLGEIYPDTLRFNILDEKSGVNLFLENSSSYNTDDLKVWRNLYISSSEVKLIEQNLSVEKNGTYFYSQVPMGSIEDTIYLQIKNYDLDTVVYTTKVIEEKGQCAKFNIGQVKFNNKIVTENGHGKVLNFLR